MPEPATLDESHKRYADRCEGVTLIIAHKALAHTYAIGLEESNMATSPP